jgi:hypothetical protein
VLRKEVLGAEEEKNKKVMRKKLMSKIGKKIEKVEEKNKWKER